MGNQNSVKRARKWMRSLCAICLLAIIFTCCIGCTPLVSMEELDALKDKLTGEIDLLTESKEAADAELATIKVSYEASQKEIEQLKNTCEAAEEEIDTLKESNKTSKEEIKSLKENAEAMEKEIDSLKADNKAAEEEINSLKEDIGSSQQEIDRLKAEIERLNEALTNLDPKGKIRIYIDQGHNPTSHHNAGAEGNGLYEQDLTFNIGRLLAELLKEDPRFEICLSRPTADTVLGTDNDSSLEARVQGAKDFGADYFISIHINSYEAATANGIEAYVAEQNSVSYAFGSSLLQGLVEATKLRDRGMKLNPELRVLKNATMPATLLELGFISNVEDSTLLSEHPELFAQGIYNGILSYFKLKPYEAPEN